MTNDRIVTGVITLSGNDPWAQGQSFMTVEQLQAQIASLTAENERLREALKPFADCVVHLHPLHDPEAETLDGIKVREWRAAYAALQPKEGV